MKVKESLPSTQANNALVKRSINSQKRSSVMSLGQLKIPCFEWKNDPNVGSKTAEYYLNLYYYQLSNNSPNNININNSNIKPRKKESVNAIDNTIINTVDDLPFIFKERSLSNADEEKIIKILKNLIIFQDVSPEILSIIASEMTLMTLPSGKIVYDLNDEGNFFYIIGKGKVGVNVNENENNILTKWHTFGEISLFTEKKREEIIITKEETELYIIDGESFRDIQKRNNEMVLKERYNFLNNIFLFECLDKISKYNVAQRMTKKEFSPNTKIITAGETGDKLYIIKEGIVSCRIGPKEIRRLSNNEYFGQNSILIDVKRGADIITLQKTICYELSKYDLKED